MTHFKNIKIRINLMVKKVNKFSSCRKTDFACAVSTLLLSYDNQTTTTILCYSMYCTGGTDCVCHTPDSHPSCSVNSSDGTDSDGFISFFTLLIKAYHWV